jgi:hypothetical protein
MAKNSTTKSGGPARVRLVVLEAEIPDGDLSSLTQALQNALRSSTTTVVQRVAASNGPKAIAHLPAPEDNPVEVEEEIADADVANTPPRPVRQRTPRKPPKAPEVVEIEMHGDVSFASFASGKNADSRHKKYMIAAA